MILAILQARVSSSRLPGKVLKPILGTPMLFLQIERIRRSRRIGQLIVATSNDPSDDVLAQECASRGVSVYRGSLTDVLDRFVGAAQDYHPSAVVRLTGDCPLADWTLIDLTIDTFVSGGFQYVSNDDPPTFPDGLDVEVVDYRALLAAHAEARLPSEREHVTPYIRNHPERFAWTSVHSAVDRSHLRWTVDEPEDFELVKTIYEALYPENPAFGTDDILAFIAAHPELELGNAGIIRNEGYLKSLAADEALASLQHPDKITR